MKLSAQALGDMIDSIVKAVDPDEIILFGSQADDTTRSDSDVDLLIVEREPFHEAGSRRQELKRIRRALSAYHIPKDILVFSRDEVEKWRHSLNHIIAHAYRAGKVVYEQR